MNESNGAASEDREWGEDRVTGWECGSVSQRDLRSCNRQHKLEVKYGGRMCKSCSCSEWPHHTANVHVTKLANGLSFRSGESCGPSKDPPFKRRRFERQVYPTLHCCPSKQNGKH